MDGDFWPGARQKGGNGLKTNPTVGLSSEQLVYRKHNLRCNLRRLDSIDSCMIPGDEGDRKGGSIKRQAPHASGLPSYERKKKKIVCGGTCGAPERESHAITQRDMLF